MTLAAAAKTFDRKVMIFLITLIPLAFLAIAAKAGPVDDLVEVWRASPHGDVSAEAFRHWDDEEDGMIPGACATCHSPTGYRDYIGADGSPAGQIDHPVPIGGTVDCQTCHNRATAEMDAVTFPSGAVVSGTGSSSRCMVCHQGRQSTPQVNAAIGGTAADDINEELRFLNVHYRAAGATLYGTEVKGGYEYDGKTYNGKMKHPEKFDSCVECHSPHSTEVRVAACGECHKDQTLETIRTTKVDLDGDGDTSEGVVGELDTMHNALLAAITEYASSVAGTDVIYANAYPYFFIDSNGNGVGDEGEAIYPNRYNTWTPRLLRAAYNYQFAAKDTGAYAHNPHYVAQILFDSLEDLSSQVDVDMAGMARP